MQLIKVCGAAEVKPDDMLPMEVDELAPLTLHNVHGEFYVTSNICTHAIAVLTDGYPEGDTVECPLHGGCFNVLTGEATHFPREEPLQAYEVGVKNGEVFVKTP